MSIPRAAWTCPVCAFETDFPKAEHICLIEECPHKGRTMGPKPASLEPYLIAHLVRGQPAFDIAIRLCAGDGVPCQPNCGLWKDGACTEVDGWIIPTSGHRAYPYWHVPVKYLAMPPNWPMARAFDEQLQGPGPAPANHPDHYSLSAAPRGQGLIKNLAERLGFVPKPPTITRR